MRQADMQTFLASEEEAGRHLVLAVQRQTPNENVDLHAGQETGIDTAPLEQGMSRVLDETGVNAQLDCENVCAPLLPPPVTDNSVPLTAAPAI